MNELAGLKEKLRAAGFDLTAELPIGRYNRAVEEQYALRDFGNSQNLGLVIASSRAFWPIFLRHLKENPERLAAPHPVDRYSEKTISPLIEACAAEMGVRFALRFAHEPPPRRVAMQRLAQAAGLAQLSPSFLSVHPEFGPWIALRAAAVFERVFEGAAAEAPDLCGPCAKPCLAPLDRAFSKAAHQSDPVASQWRAWVEVRTACPVGKSHQYSGEQIEYHYVKDIALLKALVKKK